MNSLNVAIIHSIQTLYRGGLSQRQIARKLGINHLTVRRHVLQLNGECDSKHTISTPGKLAGRKSACEGVAGIIEQAFERRLSAQRIWQDLAAEHEFRGSYQSVKRFIRGLKKADPKRVWRMECLPGEEVQVDFGTGWWLLNERGRRRKVHIFRVTLSFSRKSYSEAVLRQDTETFLRCLENAFRYFGGVR